MKLDPDNHEADLKKAERIAHLIAGHLKGTLTNEEADELDNWITASDQNLALFENLTDEDNLEFGMQQYLEAEEGKQQAFDELKQRIQLTDKKTRFRSWPLVAAASLLLLAGSFYFLLRDKPKPNAEKPTAREAVPGEVQAGSDKAVLTLSNGRTVILNTARPGPLARDGAVEIQQDSNGKISYSGTAGAVAYNTVSTPRAGQYHVVLDDGTGVWLNAESAIRFAAGMNGPVREVELKGEAYFEVARNPSRPFRVKVMVQGTEKAEVEVLGTHFNLEGYGDEDTVKATLLEGSVRVKSGGAVKVLAPGQQALIGKGIDVKPVDAQEAVAWKEGRFLFRNATVQMIGEQIKRWYDVEVRITKPVEQHFNMEISRGVPLSKLLAGLEKTGQVHFSLEGRLLLIKP